MKAEEGKIGERYLTKKGIPIKIVEIKGSQVIVKLENLNKQIGIPKNSEIKPYNDKEISSIGKLVVKPENNKKQKPVKEGSLASFIDPMLFEGKYTVKEIANEIIQKAKEYTQNKDIEANIRARMVTYKRKGYQVVKDKDKHVKVVKK